MTKIDPDLAAISRHIHAYTNRHFSFTFNPDQPKISLHEPSFGPEEIISATEQLLSTNVTMGPKVRTLEESFAHNIGFPHVVSNNSGSSANLLALAAITNQAFAGHLKPGDEVIVPALCWSTTLWPIIQCQLTPVLVDIDPETFNIDPNAIEAAIGPRTRAIMPVHVYGNPCDMDALTDIVRRHDLILIEDACEAMGATYNSQAIGSFGTIGTFSTYFSHHITTLEGGFCVTKDRDLSDLLRVLRSHGWIRDLEQREIIAKDFPDLDPRFLFINLGYNLRMTEVQAAFGLSQVEKLAGFVNTRRNIAERYSRKLEPFADRFTFQQEQKNARHSWFGFPLVLRDQVSFTRQDLTDHLNKNNIETRPMICGNIAKQPALKQFQHRIGGDLTHSDHIMTKAFSIGNHQALTPDAVDYFISVLEDFFR